MKQPTMFELLHDQFSAAKVTCVLIGGFAVNAYKVSRQTADIDFLITDTKIKGTVHKVPLEHD